jgi:glyoxylase-like metal-dependent hydrolase (beta-lactamase superfamily II)
MKVVHFPLEVNYVNIFLGVDVESRKAFLVDCGAYDGRIGDYITDQELELQFLLITHSHYDHVDGIATFKQTFDVPIYSSTSNYDHRVSEGDQICFERSTIHVLQTPGHIADALSYHIDKAVFVGDAIFSGAVGGTSDRAHFEEQISHVRNKILTLPEETVIYPGHGAPSLVGIERLFNPFFR